NIFLVRDGRVKILDFGLASLLDAASHAPASADISTSALHSLVAGTAGYMSPEQVRGGVIDRRADMFALGVVLHEMLAGLQPFKRRSALETLDASLTVEPRDLADAVPGVSSTLARTVNRCLAKSPADRFPTIGDLAAELESAIQARKPVPRLGPRALIGQPVAWATVLLVVSAMAIGGWRWRTASARAEWARNVAAPEIERLSSRGDYAEAFLLARQALDCAADDMHLRQLWLDVSVPAVITTVPDGADIAFAAYRTPTKWFSLGRTPLDKVRIPRSLIRLRLSKAGFQSI